ncbi:MAG: hypothetical protein EVJ46_00150 [Candidatus Acididesulfobacter guangdongensis]|uniref:Uncharacterized protein n=1 Tax=Acididesulfobacter guangdongensis TaxID=2597225 RepID=A0A519BHD9_ACIG2|nr:MAG: hypothetical protein EVJ46_00150 [Candidatus Acididesulfobacter guangdongensis]
MGKQRRVDLSKKDIILFKFLYKHRYANLKAINILYMVKIKTLYARLKKISNFGYIKVLKVKNMENIYTLDIKGYQVLKESFENDIKYFNININRVALNNNANHHLIIAEIGAILNNRNIDYEIDLNIKKTKPDWLLVPDLILIKNKIAFEIELEYKSMIKYEKKLAALQNTKEINKLIYIVRGNANKFKEKLIKIDEYKGGKTLDERIILDETIKKLEVLNLDDFIADIDNSDYI